MPEKALAIYRALKQHFNVYYDEKGAIGRRYRRQDEAGTPFCVTVDGDTLTAGTVTVRERDSLRASTHRCRRACKPTSAIDSERDGVTDRPARLVMVDRDGVINEDSDEYIKSVAEWRPIAGSLEAIGALTRGGYRVVVVTNQSGVGRGLFDETDARRDSPPHADGCAHRRRRARGHLLLPSHARRGLRLSQAATGLVQESRARARPVRARRAVHRRQAQRCRSGGGGRCAADSRAHRTRSRSRARSRRRAESRCSTILLLRRAVFWLNLAHDHRTSVAGLRGLHAVPVRFGSRIRVVPAADGADAATRDVRRSGRAGRAPCYSCCAGSAGSTMSSKASSTFRRRRRSCS